MLHSRPAWNKSQPMCGKTWAKNSTHACSNATTTMKWTFFDKNCDHAHGLSHILHKSFYRFSPFHTSLMHYNPTSFLIPCTHAHQHGAIKLASHNTHVAASSSFWVPAPRPDRRCRKQLYVLMFLLALLLEHHRPHHFIRIVNKESSRHLLWKCIRLKTLILSTGEWSLPARTCTYLLIVA